MPVLARAWQMLLKGHEEVKSSPRPHAAADMVLVRLAYAADLPTPGDLMRRLGDAAGKARANRARCPTSRRRASQPLRCVGRRRRYHAPSPSECRRDRKTRPRRAPPSLANPQELRGCGGAGRRETRSEAQTRALRAGAPRALPSRSSRAQSARHRAEGTWPGTDAQAEGLDRPRLDRRLERGGGCRALRGPAPRARGPRDRAHSRAPRGQAGAAAFPRRAHRRGAGD